MPGCVQIGAFDRAPAELDLDDIVILHAEFARGLAADEHRVVPDHLGDRIGQFLQPAVVVVTAVVHFGIAIENHFEVVLARDRGTRRPPAPRKEPLN